MNERNEIAIQTPPKEKTEETRTFLTPYSSIKRGRGIVASGLVNETAKGGKLASKETPEKDLKK